MNDNPLEDVLDKLYDLAYSELMPLIRQHEENYAKMRNEIERLGAENARLCEVIRRIINAYYSKYCWSEQQPALNEAIIAAQSALGMTGTDESGGEK